MDNKELVFNIGGEGGSISISRIASAGGQKFLYQHGEFDPTEKGLEVNINQVYDTFEQAFQNIQAKYCWCYLYPPEVHKDYRQFVGKQLIKKLKEESAKSADFNFYGKEIFEEILGIVIEFKTDPFSKKGKWIIS